MLVFDTKDGDTFAAETHAEIVLQMRNTQWGIEQVKREYMVDVVERVEDMTGVLADPLTESFTAQEFLEYLCYAGVMKQVEG